jgi:kinesin family member 6/9
MGDTRSYEHRGIAPRALGQLFNEIHSRVEYEYRVSCTYLELYGDKIFDLLKDLSDPNQGGEYVLGEEKDGRGVHVRGLNEVEITNENDALNLLFSGELARTTAQHKLNRRSNRSHAIFTVYVQQRQRSGINERVVHSKLHLVDLAGSERLKKTLDHPDGRGADEVTKKESMSINQSLTYLEQCVVALARKSPHIPYRQCKLTVILKDALGANCNTLMMACIWGEADHLEETISTLRLASRMMRVQNETSTVETIDSQALIRKQAKLIKALKQELLMHDALVERTGVGYEPYTPEQQTGIRQMLESYVDSTELEEDDCLQIDSYRKMLEVCKQFKRMVLVARDEAKAAKEEAYAQYGEYGASGGLGRSNAIGSEFGGSDYPLDAGLDSTGQGPAYVGEEEVLGRTGFALGLAPADSTPLSQTDTMRSDSKTVNKPIAPSAYSQAKQSTRGNLHVEFTGGDKDNDSFDSPNRQPGGTSTSGIGNRGKGLDAFTRTDGSGLHETLIAAKKVLKDVKARNKECSQVVNSAKMKIDELQEQLQEKKRVRMDLLKNSGFKQSDAEEIVDEEEYLIMKELKEAKRAYKNGYEQLQKLKAALNKSQIDAENARDVFAEEFALWNTGYAVSSGSKADDSKGYPGDSKGADDPPDQLDDQEAFERLEMERVVSKDPDSLAFFNAQKTRRAHMTQNGSNIRQIHKNKRLG